MDKSKFSRDKEALLKTLTRFDGNVTVDEVTDICEARGGEKNHTFFLQVILEAFCGVLEPDEEKRFHLFNGLYNHLVKTQFLNQRIVLDNLLPARRQMASKFTELVKQVHSKIVPCPTLSLPPPENSVYSKYQKYKQTFDELEVIAKGGFGTVCKARHKVDEVIYAVKKIIFKYKSDSDYLQVIREVKSIATLNHLNIVSYNNAWIEYLQSKCTTDSEESSSSSPSKSSSASPKLPTARRIGKKSKYSNSFLASQDNESNSLGSYSDQILETSENKPIPDRRQNLFVEILKGEFSNQSFMLSSEYSDTSNSSIETISSIDQSIISSNYSSKSSALQTYRESKDTLLSSSSWAFKNMNVKVMLCIQMEFCNCDLRLWLNRRAKGEELPFNMEVIDIFKHILSGVAHIHSKSIIHRDLKPQNIFFSTKDNVMKIGDFGLATLGQCSTDNNSVISSHYSSNLGTVPYAAPEQRSKHTYDMKVDIYSLGIILIELLMHFQTQMEFSKTINEITNGKLPTELTVKWPQYVNLLINLVQKDPKSRMSAKEILGKPPFDSEEVEKLQFIEEIRELKAALAEKNGIINQLTAKISDQACVIAKQKHDLDMLRK